MAANVGSKIPKNHGLSGRAILQIISFLKGLGPFNYYANA